MTLLGISRRNDEGSAGENIPRGYNKELIIKTKLLEFLKEAVLL